MVPKEVGNESIMFLLMIKYFNELSWEMSSLSYLIWLSDRFRPFRFLVYNIGSIDVSFMFLRASSPP